MDEDGYFQIVDRKKDMINVSGFNVYPNEVEDCIARMDAVHEVGVIGVEDTKSGEAVCAFVVKRAELTVEEVRAFCRKHLAAYKVPKQVVFLEELPKTPIGKVLRKNLRAYPRTGQDAADAPSGGPPRLETPATPKATRERRRAR
jgi:long-chain acyl-CoA synthetase